jgi:CHAT domain-containing protein
VLAFVPFETLRLPDGRYLVEKYDIRYAQSLAVAEMVKKRSALGSRGTGKPTGAGPLLAFGGAVYDPRSYGSDMSDPGGPPDEKQPADPQMQLSGEPQFDSQAHFQRFKEETLAALDRGMSTRSAYEAMGLAGWANLPGTLAEVQSIGRIVDNSTVFTGGDVQESFVKELSRTGELKGYRVLHFATHGIVVPEFPDLSAIVLSQAADDGEEDGYLTMKEISRLEVDADFVNLSACETGLGALYGGEGVVGLAQAFLVAGANGLSVSLWQVADQSTMEFMIGVYELTQEQGITYHKAMNEMKRRFIRHPRFAKPFFWAPFVYYGN